MGLLIHSCPRVWKRLRHVGISDISMPDHTRRRCDHAYEVTTPVQDRIGVGMRLVEVPLERSGEWERMEEGAGWGGVGWGGVGWWGEGEGEGEGVGGCGGEGGGGDGRRGSDM